MQNEKCEVCKIEISPRVSNFSWNRYGKPLCQNCQLDENTKTLPPKLAKFINKEISKKFAL